MMEILPNDLAFSINETTFENHEKYTLDQCYEYINYGKTQMMAIKERLSQMHKDINILPLTIYNKIKAEKQQLQEMQKQFNIIYKSIQDINVDVIAQQKECEKELEKIKTEKIVLEGRLENTEQKLFCQIQQLDIVEQDFEKSNKTVKTAEKRKKLLIYVLLFLLYAIPIVFGAMMVYGIYAIIKKELDPSYEINPIVDKFAPIIFICLVGAFYPIYKKTCKSRKKVNELVEEREIIAIKVAAETDEKNILAANFEDVTHRLEHIQNLCNNQKSKREIFEQIITFLGNFQIILKNWQKPLNKIINVYETQNFPPPNLQSFVERDQKMFTKIMLDILNNAQAVFCDI